MTTPQTVRVEFNIPILPGRTHVDIEGEILLDGSTTPEVKVNPRYRFTCNDCPFATYYVDEMLAHQKRRTLRHLISIRRLLQI